MHHVDDRGSAESGDSIKYFQNLSPSKQYLTYNKKGTKKENNNLHATRKHKKKRNNNGAIDELEKILFELESCIKARDQEFNKYHIKENETENQTKVSCKRKMKKHNMCAKSDVSILSLEQEDMEILNHITSNENIQERQARGGSFETEKRNEFELDESGEDWPCKDVDDPDEQAEHEEGNASLRIQLPEEEGNDYIPNEAAGSNDYKSYHSVNKSCTSKGELEEYYSTNNKNEQEEFSLEWESNIEDQSKEILVKSEEKKGQLEVDNVNEDKEEKDTEKYIVNNDTNVEEYEEVENQSVEEEEEGDEEQEEETDEERKHVLEERMKTLKDTIDRLRAELEDAKRGVEEEKKLIKLPGHVCSMGEPCSVAAQLKERLRARREAAAASYCEGLEQVEKMVTQEMSRLEEDMTTLQPLNKLAGDWDIHDDPQLRSIMYKHNYMLVSSDFNLKIPNELKSYLNRELDEFKEITTAL